MAARMLDGQPLVVSSFAVYGWFMLVSINWVCLKIGYIPNEIAI